MVRIELIRNKITACMHGFGSSVGRVGWGRYEYPCFFGEIIKNLINGFAQSIKKQNIIQGAYFFTGKMFQYVFTRRNITARICIGKGIATGGFIVDDLFHPFGNGFTCGNRIANIFPNHGKMTQFF